MGNIFKQYRKIVLFLFVVLILVIVFFFFKSPNYEKPISIHISHNNILFDNSLPISDSLGKEMVYSKKNKNIQGFSEITVNNPNDDKISFYIVITKDDNSKISDNYIKMYLTDKNNNPIDGYDKSLIPTFYDLKDYNKDSKRKILYKGVLNKEEERSFILRSWISDSYAISNQIEECSFKVEVII